MKDKKPFDFSTFDFDNPSPIGKDKTPLWHTPFYILGFTLFKVAIISPLLIGMYYFGKGWGVAFGWIFICIVGFFLERKK